MAKIYTRKGEQILVDAVDYEELSRFTWCTSNGYAMRKGPRTPGKQGPSIRMHRQILGLTRGDDAHVDHINGNTLDNRRVNLRLCSRSQNMHNMRAHVDNALGIKGVYKTKQGRFHTQICVCGRKMYIGTFGTPEEAHAAYRKAADEHHGEFANYGRSLDDVSGEEWNAASAAVRQA